MRKVVGMSCGLLCGCGKWVWQVGVVIDTSCSRNTWTHVPVERSQCRNEVSSDPETSFKPSTENFTALAGLGGDRDTMIHSWIS